MKRAPQAYDLVIVGASFAGLAAAKTAAMRGLRAAVLDIKPDAAHRVATVRTAPDYRLYALATTPPKPGLVHTPGKAGQAIEVELWELDQRAFGSFGATIPAPMTIGVTLLEDGSVVKGFSCEPYALDGARDITEFGGWRAFLAQKS